MIKQMLIAVVILLSMTGIAVANDCVSDANRMIAENPDEYQFLVYTSDNVLFHGECMCWAGKFMDNHSTLVLSSGKSHAMIFNWYNVTGLYFHFMDARMVPYTHWKYLKDNRREFMGYPYEDERMNRGWWVSADDVVTIHDSDAPTKNTEVVNRDYPSDWTDYLKSTMEE